MNMSITDRLAILEVIARYSYTYDSKDAAGFAGLFVEDALWELYLSGAAAPEIHLESHQAILEWATNRLEGREGTLNSRHHQCGTVFERLTENEAETRTMVLVTHQGVGDNAPVPTLSGEYRDSWRKTDEGWKFARRLLYSDKLQP